MSNYVLWTEILSEDFNSEYFSNIVNFLNERYENTTVFPPKNEIFTIFKKLAPKDVKVIILGQDPYHGDNQANGMSFSVKKGVTIPPSLRNIYLELNSDLNVPIANHGDLTAWVNQGVFLLNASLTVEKGKPNSHKDIGWQKFTDSVIQKISMLKQPKVFVLWGNFAISKRDLIEKNGSNFIITSPHPSPFSANRGFFGSRPFSKINEFLEKSGVSPINWSVE